MHRKHQMPIEMDSDFRRYYARFLQPLERQFESLRLEAVSERNRRIIAALVAWSAALGGLGFMIRPIDEFWPFLAFFGVASAAGLGLWAWLPAGAHELRLKEQVLPRIVPFFGDLQYRPEPDLVPERYSDWKLLPKFNKTHREDQIDGSYLGVPLKLAEVSLKNESSSGSSRSRSTTVAFSGLMIDFELARIYPGVTLIRSRGSDMNGRFDLDRSLKEVRGGSNFEVFTSNDAPGAAIANARFLNRLSKVSEQFEAGQLFASFHQNSLVMLIEHKGDYFEMSHRQETDFAKDAQRMRDQLSRIFAIVELLGLQRDSVESPHQPGVSRAPVFPERPGPKSADAYDVGGWGCLSTFVLFVVSVSVYLRLLDGDLSQEEVLGWSTFGGLLITVGLFQLFRGLARLSIWKLFFGILFLVGGLLVLYRYGSSDLRALIQPWISGMWYGVW